MQYAQLGKSDLVVSVIGFGCMSLHDDTPANVQLIHQAIEGGINFFDTADLYDKGSNESLVGKALQGKRDKIILATKVGNQWRSDGSGWDWNPRKEYILQAVEQSLKRLNTDYIDLYQLHGGTIDDPIDDTIEAFELLKQQGKIRAYGISSIRPNVIRTFAERSNIASVMMQYSLLDRRPEETCLSLLHEKNIGVLCRGALAQGLLTGKASKLYLGHSADAVSAAADLVNSLSRDGRNPAQTALRFALQHPAITSVIAGIRTKTQLDDILNTLDSSTISPAEMEKLQRGVRIFNYQEHR